MEISTEQEYAIRILRDAYAAFNRGDIATAVKQMDPHIDWTEPAEFPGGGTYHERGNNDGTDIFVTKLNATGSGLLYSTYLAGNGSEEGRAIAVDPGGNVPESGGSLVLATHDKALADRLPIRWRVANGRLEVASTTGTPVGPPAAGDRTED